MPLIVAVTAAELELTVSVPVPVAVMVPVAPFARVWYVGLSVIAPLCAALTVTARTADWPPLPVTVIFAEPCATPLTVTTPAETLAVATLGVSDATVKLVFPSCEAPAIADDPAGIVSEVGGEKRPGWR